MKFFPALLLTAFLALLTAANSAQNPRIEAQQTRTYRSKEFAFRYPSYFKLSVGDHGRMIRLRRPNQSPWWEDAITIRKHNRKTEECDVPQSSSPVPDEQRIIAGHRAYAYSGEDAAMNHTTKTKGYIIETRTACWRFELIRKGRPFHKFDLLRSELRQLDKQSDQDSTAADWAFKMVLNSFVLFPRGR